jgi:hypothetical protein
MVINGELNSADVDSLKEQITATLGNPIVNEWFDGSWSALHRERNILLPNGDIKRPDRVMTQGKNAVIVDYKFGREKEEHRTQIGDYLRVLQDMGYSAKGYVWYVPTGKIIEIKG